MDIRFAKALGKGAIFLVGLAAVGWLVSQSHFGEMFDKAWVDENIRGNGLAGYAIFLAFGTAFTAVGLPRQLVSFLGGYGFGLVAGTVLAHLCTLFGTVLGFYYARFLGRDMLRARNRDRVERINQAIKANPFSMTLIIRFLPVGSNLLVNLAAGVSAIPALWFFLGSLLGHFPQTLIFTLLGSGVHVDPIWKTVLSVALFLVSGILGYSLYRKHRLETIMNNSKS